MPTNFMHAALDLAERTEAEGCPSVAAAFLGIAGSFDPAGRVHPGHVLPEFGNSISLGVERQLRRRREGGR